jgi:hypothetical protein
MGGFIEKTGAEARSLVEAGEEPWMEWPALAPYREWVSRLVSRILLVSVAMVVGVHGVMMCLVHGDVVWLRDDLWQVISISMLSRS